MISKKMIWAKVEHEYSYLPTCTNMIDTLSVTSTCFIMLNIDNCRFTYYFLTLGAFIRGFAKVIKVIAVDVTYLHG